LSAQAAPKIFPAQAGSDAAHSVLLVENSRALASAVAASLNSLDGVDCVMASTLAEARREIEADVSRFFVAIVCLNLADAPNGEIVDLVKSAGLRVVVLTGFLDDERRSAMFERGIADYVIKDNIAGIEYVSRAVGRLHRNLDTRVLVVDDTRTFREYASVLLQQHGRVLTEGTRVIDDQHTRIEVAMQAPDGTRHVFDAGDIVLDHIVGDAAFEHRAASLVVEEPGQHDDAQTGRLDEVDDFTVRRVGQVQTHDGDEEARHIGLDLAPCLGQCGGHYTVDAIERIQAGRHGAGQCPAVLDQQNAVGGITAGLRWEDFWCGLGGQFGF